MRGGKGREWRWRGIGAWVVVICLVVFAMVKVDGTQDN